MAYKSKEVTAEQLRKAVRHKNRGHFLGDIGVMLLGMAFIFFAWYEYKYEQSVFYGILGICGGVFFIFMAISLIPDHWRAYRDTENVRLFLKYGSAETLAAHITEGISNRIIENDKVLITEKFIMRNDDFESYMPYESVLWIYKKTHSTNGLKDGVFLTAHDEFGDSFDYPFKLGKKHVSELENAIKTVAEKCPRAVVGFSQANRQYAAENKKALSSMER